MRLPGNCADWSRRSIAQRTGSCSTLATSVTGINENAAQDVIPVMLFLDRLAKTFWASVTFIHHVNKDSVGVEDRSIVALKGSFSIPGTVRSALTLTPANKKETEDYKWAGRGVIAEYVAKANDARARYVACYYEQITVAIATSDAVDPLKNVMQETPILVPLRPVAGTVFTDLADEADKTKRLLEAMGRGPVWVLSRSARSGVAIGENVHEVWGVDIKTALQIVNKIVSDGGFEVRPDRVGNGFRDRIFEVVP